MRSIARFMMALILGFTAGCGHVPLRSGPGGSDAGPNPDGVWAPIGLSVERRPLVATSFGSGARRIYVIAGIHGDERAGGESVDPLSDLLAMELDRSAVSVRLLRDANPDGTAHRSRRNVRGVDLNRNWPARNFASHPARGEVPLSEPETAAVHADLLAFDPHVVVVLHAARNGPYVNFDGPARREAERFADAAAAVESAWHVQPDMGYATPGSLGSLVGVDLGVPILTIEFRRGQDPREAWPALRAGIRALIDAGQEAVDSDGESVYRVR
ncbi:MAG: murein peptide amidase A [bacterium]|nr:murein peptide amidase A [bacterium]